MEESKELQQMYNILRTTIYVLLLVEFLVFVPFPFVAELSQDSWFQKIIGTISRWLIYDNQLITSIFAALSNLGNIAATAA